MGGRDDGARRRSGHAASRRARRRAPGGGRPDHGTAFSALACWSGAFVNFGRHDRLETHVVSGTYFELLGARPLRGRAIAPNDERNGARVAVISYSAWQRTFGGDPSVLGTIIPVNGEPTELIGVMPRRFVGLNPARAADLYLPLSMYSTARFDGSTPRRLDNDRDWSACEVVARLQPGVTAEAARLQVEQLVAQAPFALDRRTGPAVPGDGGRPSDDARHARIVPAAYGTDDLREQTSQALGVLMAGTLLLLLIACANVAGLQVARTPARAHELSTRARRACAW